MITFKEYLQETAVDKKPEYISLDVDKAITLLNAHCKNALWMLLEDRPIYRGDPDSAPHNSLKKHGFAAVDTTATERKSQNTSNWYTQILDNHPHRQHFPKRSRSFIASCDKHRAHDYAGWGENGEVLRLIPADDAKIGLVNREDMWDTRISLFGKSNDIESFNRKFGLLLNDSVSWAASWEKIQQFDKLLKNKDETAISHFQNVFYLSAEEAKRYSTEFLENILVAYSEKSTKHSSVTTSTMPHDYSGEVWVGGKVIIIEDQMWKQLRAAINSK